MSKNKPVHHEEAPVQSHLAPVAAAPVPGAPVQWGSRQITVPHTVQITTSRWSGQPRTVLAQVQAQPGYIEFMGEPLPTPIPVPPPVVLALVSFTGPTSATPGSNVFVTATLSAPVGAGMVAVVTLSTPSTPTAISIPAGQSSGQAAIAIPASQPLGPYSVTATFSGKAIGLTMAIVADIPNPVPPIPTPEGTLGFVAVDGKSTGTGTRDNPWSAADALTGKLTTQLAAGGTVWFLPGVYKSTQLDAEGVGYLMTVSGTPAKPLVFRGSPGGRSTIDGGLAYWGQSHDVWVQDVEFIVSEAKPTGTSGSNPSPAGSPRGGIHVYSGGAGNKCINCVLGAMRDREGKGNRQGASIWIPSREFELYGCLIVDNGWQGTDRAHGHGAYVQNPPGSYRKYLRENLFRNVITTGFTGGRYMFHLYGESPQLSNVTAEGNVVIGPEPSLFSDGFSAAPSAGYEVTGNLFAGGRVQVASSTIAPARITQNTWVNGSLEIVGDGSGQVVSGNLRVPPDARPATSVAAVRPNVYDHNRAHIVAMDWERTGQVKASVNGWAMAGDLVRIVDMNDVYGAPIFAGSPPAAGIMLPVGATGAAAFVITKGATI